MVIDSAFHEYKNVKMSRGIKNILHIGYLKKDEINEKYIPDFGVLPNFNNKNYKRLNKNEINDYYNQSLVGGIFSECEGACFASSQYLLAGLPVISINSVGGRDIWYNKDNSIICENLTEDSICEALEIAKQKLQTGEFNREKIRNIHLKQMDEHRNTIINYIQDFLGNDEKVDVISIKKQMAFF
jgi:Iap family predicted aminopeptidase